MNSPLAYVTQQTCQRDTDKTKFFGIYIREIIFFPLLLLALNHPCRKRVPFTRVNWKENALDRRVHRTPFEHLLEIPVQPFWHSLFGKKFREIESGFHKGVWIFGCILEILKKILAFRRGRYTKVFCVFVE
ncbi:MAG: hypothetical protein OEZ43_20815 [Gammaproteobacteria bacterium]|nr:hypothetical protein [Gammaproteobacteria bacterium]